MPASSYLCACFYEPADTPFRLAEPPASLPRLWHPVAHGLLASALRRERTLALLPVCHAGQGRQLATPQAGTALFPAGQLATAADYRQQRLCRLLAGRLPAGNNNARGAAAGGADADGHRRGRPPDRHTRWTYRRALGGCRRGGVARLGGVAAARQPASGHRGLRPLLLRPADLRPQAYEKALRH